MSLRRQIASCLGLLAVGILVLGCGSSSNDSAGIDPVIATELTDKLAVIGEFADLGKCDSATDALNTLKGAVDDRAPDTGEQFTSDMQELLTELGTQIDEQCQAPAEETTSTTTENTDTEPTSIPTTTSTDTTTTTTKETTTTDETTDTTPPPTTPPPTPPGGGNPDGGISPGGKKEQAR